MSLQSLDKDCCCESEGPMGPSDDKVSYQKRPKEERWWLKLLPRFLRDMVNRRAIQSIFNRNILRHGSIADQLKVTGDWGGELSPVPIVLPEEKEEAFYPWILAYNEIGRCNYTHDYVFFESREVYRGVTVVSPFK